MQLEIRRKKVILRNAANVSSMLFSKTSFCHSNCLYKLTSHEVKQSDRELLIKLNYLTPHSRYVCEGCISYAKSRTVSSNQQPFYVDVGDNDKVDIES